LGPGISNLVFVRGTKDSYLLMPDTLSDWGFGPLGFMLMNAGRGQRTYRVYPLIRICLFPLSYAPGVKDFFVGPRAGFDRPSPLEMRKRARGNCVPAASSELARRTSPPSLRIQLPLQKAFLRAPHPGSARVPWDVPLPHRGNPHEHPGWFDRPPPRSAK